MNPVAAPLRMIEPGPVCGSATGIEEQQPWVTLPGWTCRWKTPPSASSMLRVASSASEPEARVAVFKARGMTMERVGLAACSLTAWLHAGLTEGGLPAIGIAARQAKAAMAAMPNQTDRNDARGIAQIMRAGWYRAGPVTSPSCRSWRALLTARRMVLNQRREVANGVRALLREVGPKVGTPSRLGVRNRRQRCFQVAGQIETPRPPDPILRRLRADRDEAARLQTNG